MNNNLILGLVMVAFGTATLVARVAAPGSGLLSKVEPMKERWGEQAGTALHWVSYTIVPLLAGGSLIAASWWGGPPA